VPIYEYQCPKCKTIIELQQKFSEKVAPLCCEKDCNIEMESVISSTSFALKGHSWARDGYKNQKKPR
jgi:putative FmdB family regulatory protein